jgi:phage/plasmid-like protein (TIGR03299 family)
MSRHIWYDLGKIVSKNTKTANDVMRETNLSWIVEQKKIQVIDGTIIPNKVAIVRKDTNVVLGVVNSTYKCIQNSQAFSFLDEFVAKGEVSYYAAGHIRQGEKVWLLTKLHDDIRLSKQDVIQKFILFSNAHDGRGAIRAYFIPLRQKTKTLLNISFGKRVDQGIQMRHVGKVEQRIHEAKKVFVLAKDFYDAFESSIEKFYNSSFKQKRVDLFFSSCFEAYSLDSTRTQNTLKKIRQRYEKEIKTFPDSTDTAWAWLNSVVDFIDYERLSKGKDRYDQISNHLESLFWGSALLLKQKAWNTISSLIKL